MQDLSAVPWLQTVALICGLVLGALVLGYACLTIVKAQRLSGASGLLAIIGALLLAVSIWPDRRGDIDNLQAIIVDLQQQHGQLAKTLEAISGQQRSQNAVLQDRDTQLKRLQNVASQHREQIEALNNAQAKMNTWLDETQRQISQQDSQIQKLIDERLKSVSKVQDQLQNAYQLALSKLEANENLLGDISNQVKKFKDSTDSMSAEYVVQLEVLDQQDKILVKQLNRMVDQLQTDFMALQEDVKTASQGQSIRLVKASTQRELSTLRREVKQLQTTIQHLQGRRRRTP